MSENRLKYENYAQEKGFCLFFMIYTANFRKKFRNLCLVTIWPDLLRELCSIYQSQITNSEEIDKLLLKVDVSNYNYLDIKDKIKILLSLTRIAEDLQVFKQFHSQKSEKSLDLTK